MRRKDGTYTVEYEIPMVKVWNGLMLYVPTLLLSEALLLTRKTPPHMILLASDYDRPSRLCKCVKAGRGRALVKMLARLSFVLT